MQTIKTVLLVSALLLTCGSAYCQIKPSYSKVLVDHSTTDMVKKENYDLQSFVESVYINSSKLYNKALPNIEKGEYYVIVIQNDTQELKRTQTKNLKNIPISEVETFKYENSPMIKAIYGSYGGAFGLVTIKLKEIK